MRSDTKSFVKKAIKVHAGKYDYSLVNYLTNRVKVRIICPIHGVFLQTPNSHLLGTGCKRCAIERRSKSHLLLQCEFVEKAKNIAPQYDYSKSRYVHSKKKLIVTCLDHGDFLIKPNSLLNGHGCYECGRLRFSSPHYSTKEIIARCKKVHGNKYDYSESRYLGFNKNMKIICKIHGPFFQQPHNHISNKAGCPKCKCEKIGNLKRETTRNVIRKFRKVHGNVYDYSKVEYGSTQQDKVEIICSKHGPFIQSPNAHLAGSGCPFCKKSKGEGGIREWLISHSIEFISEYRFSKMKMRFDFYLPSLDICIEYDGELHYKPFRKSSSGLEKLQKTQKNDIRKNNYCRINGIKLIRIPYTRINSIPEILSKEIGE